MDTPSAESRLQFGPSYAQQDFVQSSFYLINIAPWNERTMLSTLILLQLCWTEHMS